MSNPTCLVCGNPLPDLETSLHRSWCYACAKCQICNAEGLDEDIITRALANGEPIAHTGCRDAKALRDLKDITIPLRVEQIDLLNREITSQWRIEPLIADVDYLRSVVVKLQECAANVSMVLGRTKEKISVREAQDYRIKTKAEREAERTASRAKETEKIEKANHSAQLEAERKDPALRLRRKQLEAFLNMGLSPVDAEKAVTEALARAATRKEQVQ
jgi:hypothetical protein